MNNFYTELDTLIDTRLAIASMLDPDGTAKAVLDGSYSTRIKNNIGNISGSIIENIYKDRNKNLLLHSIPTKMFKLIKDYISEVMYNILNVESMSMKLYVNIYPYKLNSEEQEYIYNMLQSKFPGISILIVDMSNEELTPDWVYQNIKYLFKYDVMDWIELHTSNKLLITRPMFGINIFTPCILTNSVKSSDVDEKYIETIKKSVETVADINFIDSDYFSAHIKTEKNK